MNDDNVTFYGEPPSRANRETPPTPQIPDHLQPAHQGQVPSPYVIFQLSGFYLERTHNRE